jgi:hypothetical protein
VTRASRVWHVGHAPGGQYGDYLAADQWGGFIRRCETEGEARAAIEREIAEHPGDRWASE